MRHALARSSLVIVSWFLCLAGCSSSDEPAPGASAGSGGAGEKAGSSGSGGASGHAGSSVAGTGGSGGSPAGQAGSASGQSGASGQAGQAGQGGSAGQAGQSGVAGQAGSGAGDFTLLGSLSAGWALNEWHELANSHLRDVYLSHAQADAIDPQIWQVSGPDAAIQVWSSGAFDGRRLLIGAAGGHGGYNGNEMYAFDLTTLTWTRLYDPSPTATCAPNGGGADCTTKWGPQALHQYDGLVHSASTHSIFNFGTGPKDSCWVWRLDEVSNLTTSWHSFACAPNMPTAYMKTAEDPVSGKIIVFGGGLTGIAALDPVALTWSKTTGGDAVYASYSVADFDPARGRVHALGVHSGGPLYQKRDVVSIDASSLAVSESTTIPPDNVSDYACFLYHPPSKKMIAWNGDQHVWSWDPDTDVWTAVATTGVTPTTSATNGGGIHSKCGFEPSLGVLFGVNNADRGVWAMRLSLE